MKPFERCFSFDIFMMQNVINEKIYFLLIFIIIFFVLLHTKSRELKFAGCVCINYKVNEKMRIRIFAGRFVVWLVWLNSFRFHEWFGFAFRTMQKHRSPVTCFCLITKIVGVWTVRNYIWVVSAPSIQAATVFNMTILFFLHAKLHKSKSQK